MAWDPKFSGCESCRHFIRNAIFQPKKCRSCDAGEFFEEEIHDEAPDDNQLMTIFSRMHDDSQD